jgi:hypothetical protein
MRRLPLPTERNPPIPLSTGFSLGILQAPPVFMALFSIIGCEYSMLARMARNVFHANMRA